MVTVEERSSEEWLELTITGHAGYAEKGKDIVCAGVSAIAGALVSFLSETVSKACVKTEEGRCHIVCPRLPQTETAFSVARAGYGLLMKTYPAYVQVIPPERV